MKKIYKDNYFEELFHTVEQRNGTGTGEKFEYIFTCTSIFENMIYVQHIKWEIDNTGHKGNYCRNKGLD